MNCIALEQEETGLDIFTKTRRMTQLDSVIGSTESAQHHVLKGKEASFLGLRVGSRISKAYLFRLKQIWHHLPAAFQLSSLGQSYGRHVHAKVRFHAERRQYFATFFLRNRAELALMCRLLNDHPNQARLNISVLACSKGAEVYSILWGTRSARPDLRVRMHAVDISEEILKFAERGVYSLDDIKDPGSPEGTTGRDQVTRNTGRDQNAPIFERMTDKELQSMCESEDGELRIKPWLKEGIVWISGDANDPELAHKLGPQDIVVANRFLCHMAPDVAEKCLRNLASLVRPGGHLFVSGVDLDVRTKVAREMGWKPVTDLMKEIHEGDASLTRGWPLEYWGLEPFCEDRSDCKIRYASVFQIGENTAEKHKAH